MLLRPHTRRRCAQAVAARGCTGRCGRCYRRPAVSPARSRTSARNKPFDVFDSTMRAFFSLALVAAFATDVLTQPAQPTHAIQLSRSYDIRFPSTVSQCEPVLIYHNTPESYAIHIYTMDSESGVSRTLVRLTVPRGIGYLEWTCNVPVGYTFVVLNAYAHVLSVQPGSSVACLGDVTATYAYADYETTDFRSYTAHPANPTAPDIAAFRGV